MPTLSNGNTWNMDNINRSLIFLNLSTFFIGISASIAQAIMIRELLTLFKGNELSIGIIMVLWFTGIIFGAAFSKKIKRPYSSIIATIITLHPAIACISLIFFYSIPLVYHNYGSFYPLEAEIVIAFICLFPQCFVIGYIFPVLVQTGSVLKINNPGTTIFLLESLGAFIGGILFTFLLVQKLNPLSIQLVLFIAACSIALIIIQQIVKRMAIVTAIVLAGFIAFHSSSFEKKLLTASFAANHPGSLLEYRRTPYQIMYVAQLSDTIALYGNSNLYAQFPDDYSVRPIIHTLVASGIALKDANILIAGDTAFVPYVCAYMGANIDYITVDCEMWQIIQKNILSIYPDFPINKLSIYYDDTRNFFNTAKKKYKSIIILPPPPDSILHNRLYTRELFNDCKKHLSKDGVFILQIEGFANIMNPSLRRYIASVINSFRQVFPSSLISAGDSIYCIGFNYTRTTDVSNYLSEYIKNFPKNPDAKMITQLVPGFNPEEFRMYFQESHYEYLSEQVKSENIINTDLIPKGYFEYLANSLKQSNSLAEHFITNPYLLAAALLIIVITSIVKFTSRGKHHLMYGSIIFITGFISMAAMFIALIAYQNVYGILYYRIALCNGVFMLGLAIGSVTTFIQKDFFITRIVLMIAGLLLLFGFTFYNSAVMFYLSITIIAATTGSFLPLLLNKPTEDIHLLASTLNSFDHIGALCGSLITPFLMLPIFGIYSLLIMIVLGVIVVFFKMTNKFFI
ncbi:MAG: hypothetical protein N3F66_13105 [Spirochaetes bacterium]|nr:hypothetical protein [Spirochaetota bacterium]